MADNVFSEVAGGVVEKIFSGMVWFIVAIIVIGAVAGLMWFFLIYKRKFDIKVKIISYRADDRNAIIFDKAAILVDRKTKSPYLRVWGLKRDFPVPRYSILQKTNEGDYLEIYRKSEDEFYFLNPPAINKKVIMKLDGKLHAFADQEHTLFDPEMTFWIAKRREKNKSMFDTESLLMKLLPYIPHIIGGVVLIFVLYILLDHLPAILSAMENLAKQMAQMQRAEVVPTG